MGFGAPVLGTVDRRGIRNAILSRVPILWSQVHTAQSLPFPRLLEALARGERTVVLDDGTLGMIPDEWLRRYGSLAGLGSAERRTW